MIKFLVKNNYGSKYFSEDEKDKADQYFSTRARLGLPCSYWIVQSSLYGDVQTCISKTM